MNNQLNLSDDELEIVEAYDNGQLDEEGTIAFESRYRNDQLWREKVDEFRLTILAIKEVSFKSQLDEMHAAVSQPENSTRKINFTRVAIAATVIAVAILATWWYTNKPASNERLYHAYYQPDPGLMTTMGITDDYNFQKAMVEYKSGSYDAALNAWLGLERSRPANDTLNYFIGAAYHAKEEYEKAIKYLQPITQQPSHPFYRDACWYLGLIWLKKNESEKAKVLLQASENSKAAELVERLK